jgi:hypothetical protein
LRERRNNALALNNPNTKAVGRMSDACAQKRLYVSPIVLLAPTGYDAWSQAARTIKIVVPFPAGGSADILARSWASRSARRKVRQVGHDARGRRLDRLQKPSRARLRTEIPW